MKKGILYLLGFAFLATAAAFVEVRTSFLQSRLFSDYAARLTYRLESGSSDAIVFPDHGPYNARHGYTELGNFVERLQNRSFEVTQQSRFSEPLLKYVDYGGNPPYVEKLQSGLRIVDNSDAPLYQFNVPERLYRRFEDIPPLLVETLLFIENRELLDQEYPHRNPAVEWDRLVQVLIAHSVDLVQPGQDTAGASTLATQLEKYRYSPAGLTVDVEEKLRQMVSASIRAYRGGPETIEARRRIVRDYVNSTPLAGKAGFGEILGVGEGLWAWYGIGFEEANRFLSAETRDDNLFEKARIYKSAISLLLSQRRPSHYLLGGREELARLTDSYLRLLAGAGVIEDRLRDAALSQPLIFRTGSPDRRPPHFADLKAVNNIRTRLLNLLGLDSLYVLDRLDVTVHTTVASRFQEEVSTILQNLTDPAQARAMGLLGHRLLDEDQLDAVRFSVVLYESTPEGNKLRIQTDNMDMPFDLNDSSKLDLGSTAKLRTLVTYLHIIETQYHRHRGGDFRRQAGPGDVPADPLRQWVAGYLQSAPEASLEELLDAAMNRRYSASPAEWFFTASGRHRFHNFDKDDNYRTVTVAEAFNRSVNLVFIRMMRDISRFYINEIPGVNDLLENRDNPIRRQYLRRFADQEGQEFLLRFYRLYRGGEAGQLLETLARRTRPVPYRLAMAFRSVHPEAGVDAMKAFLRRRLGEEMPGEQEIEGLYHDYGKDKFDSNDRAYLAGLHPLELWLVAYLRENPGARFEELVAASVDARQIAYEWLFRTKSWNKQQKRIRILLEQDAFDAIHRQWRQLGYPFPSLVPSYATALGVSADRPTALTELMGIILNDGLKLPMREIEALHFAAGTPYETDLEAVPLVGERVLSPELARTVKTALAGIVESGTARRLKDTYQDAEGNLITVGGKTGTGDHRSKQFDGAGRLISEKVVNRNAIFTFFIGDRFFGTILANVHGSKARDFDFTSGLAVQLLKSLEPALNPLINETVDRLAGEEGNITPNDPS